ncbi:MAG: DUF1249 domain-containing protein [Pseudomonadales bacterium]|nr:DUF1249 domain-containing protein [Pseudomonadales bacterium]
MTLTQQQTHKKPFRMDLASHMALCEMNYCRLLKLLPRMRENQSYTVALPDTGDQPFRRLRLSILERSPYTTLIELAQLDASLAPSPKPESGEGYMAVKWGLEPSLRVRVYHDAKMAEVVGFQKENYFRSQYHYPNRKMYQRDEKQQLNLLLGEWLAYCFQFGLADDWSHLKTPVSG